MRLSPGLAFLPYPLGWKNKQTKSVFVLFSQRTKKFLGKLGLGEIFGKGFCFSFSSSHKEERHFVGFLHLTHGVTEEKADNEGANPIISMAPGVPYYYTSSCVVFGMFNWISLPGVYVYRVELWPPHIPKKICSSPHLQKLCIWLYLEIRSLIYSG